MSSGSVDLGATFNQGGSGGGSVNTVTGQTPIFSTGGTDPVISITQADSTHDGFLSSGDFNTFSAKGTGFPNTVAAFDGAGNLESLPGWNVNSNGGISSSNNIDQANGNNYVDIGPNNVPSAPSTSNTTVLNVYENIDPTNTGFALGNATTGDGSITLLNLSMEQITGSSANIGTASLIGGGSTFGDGVTGAHMHDFSLISLDVEVTNNYQVDQIMGIGVFHHLNTGSIVGQYTGLTINPSINTNLTGYSSGIGIFPNLGAGNTIEHWHALELGGDANTTGVITDCLGLNVYFNDVHCTDYSNIEVSANNVVTTNYTAFNLNANVVAATNFHFLNMYADSATSATNVFGLGINLTQVTSPNQIVGLDIQGGGLNLNYTYDTSILTPAGEFQVNQLGGELLVASGHPITSGAFGFGNNIGISLSIQDDILPDASGVGLGFSSVGFVGLVEVAAGKTADTINMMAAGAGIGGGSGNITNATMFRALGFLPEGGTLNITNLYGFKADPVLAFVAASNTWGFYDGSGSENFVSKLAINTASKKVTNGSVALEVAGGKAFLNSRMDTSQRNSLTAIGGMLIYNTDTGHLEYYNDLALTWTPI